MNDATFLQLREECLCLMSACLSDVCLSLSLSDVCLPGGGAQCSRYKSVSKLDSSILFSSSEQKLCSFCCFSETWQTLFSGADLRAAMSHVDVKNMKPTSFEDEYYDQYEFYNLTDKYAGEVTSLFKTLKRTWDELVLQDLTSRVGSVNRGLGPERQDEEGGQWEHQQTEPVRTRAQNSGEIPKQRKESQGVNSEVSRVLVLKPVLNLSRIKECVLWFCSVKVPNHLCALYSQNWANT